MLILSITMATVAAPASWLLPCPLLSIPLPALSLQPPSSFAANHHNEASAARFCFLRAFNS